MKNLVYISMFIIAMLFTICVAVALFIPYIILSVVFRFWKSEIILSGLSLMLAVNDAMADWCGDILSQIND